MRKSSGGLLVVHASTVALNSDKFADALRESKGRGQVSVRLAGSTVVNVPGVWMDLIVKLEDFDSTEAFLVLDMDKYDLILGMPWLEKREPWIDWHWGLPVCCLRQSILPDGTDQVDNVVPQTAEVDEESAEGVSSVVEEDAEGASGVGNIVPREVEKTKSKSKSTACVSSVGNVVPREVEKTNTRAEVPLSTSHVDNKVPHSESETPPARSGEEQCHVFDGVSGRQVKADAVHLGALPEVSALLNLEELSMKDFLAELKAGEIAEMVLLKSETSPEDLNSSSVMDEDVLEGFTKQRATRLGSDILKNPEDPVYPLVKEYSVSLPREQCEVIDAFFTEMAKSGMARESKSPHSTPTFCIRKPNGKWRLIHAYNKLNNATVPAQTPIPRKDVLLNNMSGCTLYSALDLVDGYYQILMRESDIPLTAVSTPSGMLWEWLVMPQGLSNAPATFNRLVTQLFRPLRTFAQTYFDDTFVHSRAEGDQTTMEVHLKHLRRVIEVMRANKLYTSIDKCVFAAEKIDVLGGFVSRVGIRADPGKDKPIAAWPAPISQKDLRV
ncbi:RNA-directed DNA polymerase [Phytophthora palmivora]|uniref:RNA-directed DNA polymerase n=1 Tax=Phytophthora palmivora TaxID=4796 RepID=A0A2P4YLU6_9STRA|nr:RNA-directed DNA polymerase [Phytophthora palmivora]